MSGQRQKRTIRAAPQSEQSDADKLTMLAMARRGGPLSLRPGDRSIPSRPSLADIDLVFANPEGTPLKPRLSRIRSLRRCRLLFRKLKLPKAQPLVAPHPRIGASGAARL